MKYLTGDFLLEYFKRTGDREMQNASQGRYREDGKWYALLDRFPSYYFDAYGCVRFESVKDYRDSGLQLRIHAHIQPDGIRTLRGYRRLTPAPHTLKNLL